MNDRENYPFPQGKPEHRSYPLLLSWWQELKRDKGKRAMLRRAASLTEVMMNPAYLHLLRTLRQNKLNLG